MNLENTPEMWRKDEQEEEELEYEKEEEDYLPPLSAYKISNRNKRTQLGAIVFLVKKYDHKVVLGLVGKTKKMRTR